MSSLSPLDLASAGSFLHSYLDEQNPAICPEFSYYGHYFSPASLKDFFFGGRKGTGETWHDDILVCGYPCSLLSAPTPRWVPSGALIMGHSYRYSLGLCLRGRFKGCSFMLLKLCIQDSGLLLQKCTAHFLSLFLFLNPDRLACSFIIPTPAVSKHPGKGSFREKGLIWLIVRGCGPSRGKEKLCSGPLLLFMPFRTRVQGMAVRPFMVDLPVSRYLKKIILHRHAMSMAEICIYTP